VSTPRHPLPPLEPTTPCAAASPAAQPYCSRRLPLPRHPPGSAGTLSTIACPAPTTRLLRRGRRFPTSSSSTLIPSVLALNLARRRRCCRTTARLPPRVYAAAPSSASRRHYALRRRLACRPTLLAAAANCPLPRRPPGSTMACPAPTTRPPRRCRRLPTSSSRPAPPDHPRTAPPQLQTVSLHTRLSPCMSSRWWLRRAPTTAACGWVGGPGTGGPRAELHLRATTGTRSAWLKPQALEVTARRPFRPPPIHPHLAVVCTPLSTSRRHTLSLSPAPHRHRLRPCCGVGGFAVTART